MNQKFNNQNSYEGNGWSKYQLMVLQQLDDHNKVLQNLNTELTDVKQQMAVSEAELKMWRGNAMSTLDNLDRKISHILYDDKGLNRKVSEIEKNIEVEEKATMKHKAVWAFIGAVAVFFSNMIIKLYEFIQKN